MAAQIFPRWNPLTSWMRQIEDFQRVGCRSSAAGLDRFNGLERAVLSPDQYPQRCPVAPESIVDQRRNADLPSLRTSAVGGHADRPMYRHVRLCEMCQNLASQGGRLLRVLFLRRSPMPSDPGRKVLEMRHTARALEREQREPVGDRGAGGIGGVRPLSDKLRTMRIPDVSRRLCSKTPCR